MQVCKSGIVIGEIDKYLIEAVPRNEAAHEIASTIVCANKLVSIIQVVVGDSAESGSGLSSLPVERIVPIIVGGAATYSLSHASKHIKACAEKST